MCTASPYTTNTLHVHTAPLPPQPFSSSQHPPPTHTPTSRPPPPPLFLITNPPIHTYSLPPQSLPPFHTHHAVLTASLCAFITVLRGLRLQGSSSTNPCPSYASNTVRLPWKKKYELENPCHGIGHEMDNPCHGMETNLEGMDWIKDFTGKYVIKRKIYLQLHYEGGGMWIGVGNKS